jgi:hypothetical protein
MNTKYISKIFSGAIFSGILMLALFGISASNVMAQAAANITVKKDVCNSVGATNACNGNNRSLEGRTLEFTVTDITTPSMPMTLDSIFVTINLGGGSNGQTKTGNVFTEDRTYRVCEVLPNESPFNGFDSLPQPGASTGGQQTAGGPGFEDCIIVTAGPGGNVLQFVNVAKTLAPTAATAMVAGRILTDNNASLRRSVAVTILNTRTLETQTVMANRLGYYQFDDLQVGDTYIITVRSKGYTFTPETISLSEDSSLNMFGRVSESPRTKGRGRIF